jgi:hypothetical protein
VAHIIQEITNRDGWQAGNGLAFIFTQLEGHRDAMSREEHMNKGPELFVRYAVGKSAQTLIVQIDKSELRLGQSVTTQEAYSINNIAGHPSNSGNNFGIWKENVPVEWENIKAYRMVDNVELKWRTDITDVNSHFEVQKSTDGINWEILDELMVRPTQDESTEYQSFDYSDDRQSAYYRVKHVDRDGNINYSPIQKMKATLADNQVDVFPIPANDFITVRPIAQENILVSLVSMSGKVITSASVQDIHTFRTGHLPKGVYFVKTDMNGSVQSRKVLIQH